jgi:hypothetical protein
MNVQVTDLKVPITSPLDYNEEEPEHLDNSSQGNPYLIELY